MFFLFDWFALVWFALFPEIVHLFTIQVIIIIIIMIIIIIIMSI